MVAASNSFFSSTRELSFNQLTAVPETLFATNKLLTDLVLSSNYITQLPMRLLHTTPLLITL